MGNNCVLLKINANCFMWCVSLYCLYTFCMLGQRSSAGKATPLRDPDRLCPRASEMNRFPSCLYRLVPKVFSPLTALWLIRGWWWDMSRGLREGVGRSHGEQAETRLVIFFCSFIARECYPLSFGSSISYSWNTGCTDWRSSQNNWLYNKTSDWTPSRRFV